MHNAVKNEMQNAIEQYFTVAVELLQTVARESGEAMLKTATAIADALENGKDFLLFGSGHSALIAKDATGRAGGLMPALALEDLSDGDGERIEGLAKIILGRYELVAGSVIVLISNSGINPVPIEMAMQCKEAGLTVVAITSVAHSQRVASRHSSGKRLFELADIVIDTHAIPGDAAVQLPGSPVRSGATSTVAGSAILQAVSAQVATILIERGHEPPVFMSANLPEGDAHNRTMLARYRPRLIRYQISAYQP